MRHFGRFSNNVRIWRITDYLRSECTKYDFHEFDSIRLYPHENLLIDRQLTKQPGKLATETKLLSWFLIYYAKTGRLGGPFVQASNNGLQYANELGGAEKVNKVEN